jgi:hypothetical protein
MATTQARAIAALELDALLGQSQCIKDEELSCLADVSVYNIADGKVLVVCDEEDVVGWIWPSRQIVLSYFSRASERRSHYLMEGRLPQGPDFPNHTLTLIDELADILSLSRRQLDFTLPSIECVDKQLRTKVGRDARIEPPVFPCLIAYVGETLRKLIGGNWEMRQVEVDVWEPWVISADGRELPVFVNIYYEVHELVDTTGNLMGAISSKVNPFIATRFDPEEE